MQETKQHTDIFSIPLQQTAFVFRIRSSCGWRHFISSGTL